MGQDLLGLSGCEGKRLLGEFDWSWGGGVAAGWEGPDGWEFEGLSAVEALDVMTELVGAVHQCPCALGTGMALGDE